MKAEYRFLRTQDRSIRFARIAILSEPSEEWTIRFAPTLDRMARVYDDAVRAGISLAADQHQRLGGQAHAIEVQSLDVTAVDTTVDAVRCAAAAVAWKSFGRDEAEILFSFADNHWEVAFKPTPQQNAILELCAAAFEGDAETVSHILDSGCDVNAAHPVAGDTPLLCAIENDQEHVIQLLLERGADPNRRGHQGVTPLQLAVDVAIETGKHDSDLTGQYVSPSMAAVSLLLAAGANPHQTDDRGESAIDWAREVGAAEFEILTGKRDQIVKIVSQAKGDLKATWASIGDELVSWEDLAEAARTGGPGLCAAALLSLGRRSPDDPRTVALLEELATGPTRHKRIMGLATVGHVCLLVLREMPNQLAQQTFARLRAGWDAADRADMELVLGKRL